MCSPVWEDVEMDGGITLNETRSVSWYNFLSKLFWTWLFDDNVLENTRFALDIHC